VRVVAATTTTTTTTTTDNRGNFPAYFFGSLGKAEQIYTRIACIAYARVAE
jgi:hypothetical protein